MVEKNQLKPLAEERGQVSLVTGAYGRLSLTKPGITSLVERYGLRVKSRMTKLDIWTMFSEVPVGAAIIREIFEIFERQAAAAWDRDTMSVEMGILPDEDGEGINTGVGIAPPSYIYPVARLEGDAKSPGLEQLLYSFDPRNEVSNADEREYYRLLDLKADILRPWIPYAKYRDILKELRNEAYQEAKAADKAKGVQTRKHRELVEKIWDYKWEPSRHSLEFHNLAEEREFNGKTLVNTPIDRVVNGFDTFISSKGSSAGWALMRRDQQGKYSMELPLLPTASWKIKCRVARDMQEIVVFNRRPGAYAELFQRRLDDMIGHLRESCTRGIIVNEEEFIALRNDLEAHVNAEMRGKLVRAVIHPQRVYSIWEDKFEESKVQLKALRASANEAREDSSKWELWWDLKAELALAYHRSNEAWNTLVDQGALEDVNAAIAAVHPETTSRIWQEDKWLTNSPDNAGKDNQQVPTTWEQLGIERDLEVRVNDEVKEAYKATFVRPRCGSVDSRAGQPCKCQKCRPQRGLTTNESARNKLDIETTLNEGKFWHFVDPAIALKGFYAFQEVERVADEKKLIEMHGGFDAFTEFCSDDEFMFSDDYNDCDLSAEIELDFE